MELLTWGPAKPAIAFDPAHTAFAPLLATQVRQLRPEATPPRSHRGFRVSGFELSHEALESNFRVERVGLESMHARLLPLRALHAVPYSRLAWDVGWRVRGAMRLKVYGIKTSAALCV